MQLWTAYKKYTLARVFLPCLQNPYKKFFYLYVFSKESVSFFEEICPCSQIICICHNFIEEIKKKRHNKTAINSDTTAPILVCLMSRLSFSFKYSIYERLKYKLNVNNAATNTIVTIQIVEMDSIKNSFKIRI